MKFEGRAEWYLEQTTLRNQLRVLRSRQKGWELELLVPSTPFLHSLDFRGADFIMMWRQPDLEQIGRLCVISTSANFEVRDQIGPDENGLKPGC